LGQKFEHKRHDAYEKQLDGEESDRNTHNESDKPIFIAAFHELILKKDKNTPGHPHSLDDEYGCDQDGLNFGCLAPEA
jgi:hypothetical protein